MVSCPILARIPLHLRIALHDLQIVPEAFQRSHALVELEVRPEALRPPLIHDHSVRDVEIGGAERSSGCGEPPRPRLGDSPCPNQGGHSREGNAGPQAAQKRPASDLFAGKTHRELKVSL